MWHNFCFGLVAFEIDKTKIFFSFKLDFFYPPCRGTKESLSIFSSSSSSTPNCVSICCLPLSATVSLSFSVWPVRLSPTPTDQRFPNAQFFRPQFCVSIFHADRLASTERRGDRRRPSRITLLCFDFLNLKNKCFHFFEGNRKHSFLICQPKMDLGRRGGRGYHVYPFPPKEKGVWKSEGEHNPKVISREK